ALQLLSEGTVRATAFPRRLFFFQAENGIQDYKVTGVQTCALPIWGVFGGAVAAWPPCGTQPHVRERGRHRRTRPPGDAGHRVARSEERRVGKECWSTACATALKKTRSGSPVPSRNRSRPLHAARPQ